MKDWLADNEQEFYYETQEEAESCYPIGTELMLKRQRRVIVSGYTYVEDGGWLPCYEEECEGLSYLHTINLSALTKVIINY